MARRLISAIGAGSLTVALMLGISGCANPLEQVIEAQTGAKIDTDSGGTTIETEDGKVEVGTDIELPADFPAELPTPDATLVAAVSVGSTGWQLQYEGVDNGMLESLIADLTALGLKELSRATVDDGLILSLSNDVWLVSLVWDDTAGGSQALVYGIAAA